MKIADSISSSLSVSHYLTLSSIEQLTKCKKQAISSIYKYGMQNPNHVVVSVMGKGEKGLFMGTCPMTQAIEMVRRGEIERMMPVGIFDATISYDEFLMNLQGGVKKIGEMIYREIRTRKIAKDTQNIIQKKASKNSANEQKQKKPAASIQKNQPVNKKPQQMAKISTTKSKLKLIQQPQQMKQQQKQHSPQQSQKPSQQMRVKNKAQSQDQEQMLKKIFIDPSKNNQKVPSTLSATPQEQKQLEQKVDELQLDQLEQFQLLMLKTEQKKQQNAQKPENRNPNKNTNPVQNHTHKPQKTPKSSLSETTHEIPKKQAIKAQPPKDKGQGTLFQYMGKKKA